MRLAEYLQVGSTGHDRQLVAVPASLGFRARLKWCSEPVLETVDGRCGCWLFSAQQSTGEHRSHKRMSMSWQLLVSKLGAEVRSRRLRHVQLAIRG